MGILRDEKLRVGSGGQKLGEIGKTEGKIEISPFLDDLMGIASSLSGLDAFFSQKVQEIATDPGLSQLKKVYDVLRASKEVHNVLLALQQAKPPNKLLENLLDEKLIALNVRKTVAATFPDLKEKLKKLKERVVTLPTQE